MRFPILVVTLLLLRLAAPVQGQSDTLRWQAARRLSPADFRGTGALRSAPDLHVELGGRGLFSFFIFESVAVWNRRAARLAPGDTLRLRQAQVLFDLTEWHARRLQERLLLELRANATPLRKAPRIREEVRQQWQKDLTSAEADLRNDPDASQLARWESTVRQRLAELPRKPLPLSGDCWATGFYLGGIYRPLRGTLGERFHPPLGAAIEFELRRQRWTGYLGVYLHGTNTRRAFRAGGDWDAREYVNCEVYELALGRVVHESRRTRLVPHLGLGYGLFKPRRDEARPERNDRRVSAFFPTAGVLGEYRFLIRERYHDRRYVVLRSNLTVAPFRFSGDFAGQQLHLSLMLGRYRVLKAVRLTTD